MTDSPVLSVEHVSKRFGSTQALRDVSLDLHTGEVLALVGDNGAGKSTLVNIIAGVIEPDEGAVFVDGIREDLGSPTAALDAGIETVFQDLALISSLDITENIFLRREVFGPGPLLRILRRMDRRSMRRRVADAYERLGLDLPPPQTKVVALSGGQRQAVAIARAVIFERKLVLLDEPTAALGVKQTGIVLNFIERLKEQNVAVMLITHNLEHVQRVADRAVVLRLGRKAFDTPMADTHGRELVARMTGAVVTTEGP